MSAHEPPLAGFGPVSDVCSPVARSTTSTSLGSVSALSCLTTTAQSLLISTSEMVRPSSTPMPTPCPSDERSTLVLSLLARASHSGPLT